MLHSVVRMKSDRYGFVTNEEKRARERSSNPLSLSSHLKVVKGGGIQNFSSILLKYNGALNAESLPLSIYDAFGTLALRHECGKILCFVTNIIKNVPILFYC